MRVILFDLDCLRPDHLSCYGYHRNTSPTIDAIAAEGFRFNHCHASNSPCLPARAALFSGRFGVKNGVETNWEDYPFRFPYRINDIDAPMLQAHLVRNRIKATTFSPFADRHDAAWFSIGWTEHHDHVNKRGQERADEVNKHFLPWLKQNVKEDNQLIHVHYWDIHSHYRTPEDRAHIFDNEPAPEWPDESTIRWQYENLYGPRTPHDLYTGYKDEDHRPVPYMPDEIKCRDDFVKLINGYDATIRYTDDHIAQVIDIVKKAGVWDDTAIIITGDHGDSFGNQGQYMDHGLSNEAVTRVPMIVRWPGTTNGGQSDGLIYTLDLCPTLCDMFGIRKPKDWDGDSFKPALEGNRFAGRPYLVVDHGIYTLQRSVRTLDWMLIRTLHPGLYPYDDEFWLYDMQNDWHQTTNVAGDNPDVVQELLAMMDEWWYRNAAPNQPDPLALAIERGEFRYFTPEQMVARLRRTGRAHFVDDLLNRLRKFHGNKFEHLRQK